MLSFLKNLWLITKPRLSRMVVLTSLAGAAVAPGALSLGYWVLFALGSYCIVGAANAFNCYLERDVDALMKRTQNRPLVTGSLKPETAFIFAAILSVLGLFILGHFFNALTAVLGLLGFALYVWAYTPLKRHSMSALFVGAIPGAVPPMMGWAAASGQVGIGAWILFAILFFWQLPHFISISLHWHKDYEAAGLKTLSDSVGPEMAKRHMIFYSFLLISVSLIPAFAHLAGPLYLWTSIAMGSLFIGLCVAGIFKVMKLNWNRIIFVGSIVYLPVILGAWILAQWVDRI